MRVGLRASDALFKQLKAEIKLIEDEGELTSTFEQCLKDNSVIPFRIIRKTYEHLSARKSEKVYLHELLDGSEIAFQLPEPPARNPVLEARIQRLKTEQAEREYKQMTANVSSPGNTSLSFSSEVKAVRSQLIAVANFVLTVVGTFAAVYKAVEYILPSPDIPMQVFCGVIAASGFAIAELYFLLKTV